MGTFVILFIDRIYCCLFIFYPVRRIQHDWNLFYEICNTTTEHNWRQTHYLSMILNYFDIYFQVNQKVFFITSSASSLHIISMLSLFDCITRSSSFWSLEELKVTVIVNWIFHVSDCLRAFTRSLIFCLI